MAFLEWDNPRHWRRAEPEVEVSALGRSLIGIVLGGLVLYLLLISR